MLILIAAGALVLGAALGADDDASDPPAEPDLPAACAGAEATDVRRLAGAMLVVRSSGEPDPELVRRAARGDIAGVILFPSPELPERRLAATIAELQQAVAEAGLPPLVVAIDQEGGPVKRLPLAPPQRAPIELADFGAADARLEGAATATHLRGLGINVDLAPVLDVPVDSTSVIATRAFGSDPETVTELGLAFAEGLRSERVAATVKHFPGLGRATVNTDLAPATIEAGRGELRGDLEPFRAAIEAGTPLVMVSAASYPGLGAAGPALASREVVAELLRERLGFDGVVITDDLDAGAVTATLGAGDAAVAAARAGVDLLLFAQQGAAGVGDALVAAEREGRLELEALRDSCARTFALREELAAPG